MLTTPTRSDEEVASNTTFEALLWAMSRPGRVRDLPSSGGGALITALLDRECAVFCEDPLLIPPILQTGAMLSDIADADHVFLGSLGSAERLNEVDLGSDLYPDDGATIILRATIGSGPDLRLTGPGIDGMETLRLDGVPCDMWDLRKRLIRYPRGFDLFIIDGTKVVGLPRSTNIEVL